MYKKLLAPGGLLACLAIVLAVSFSLAQSQEEATAEKVKVLVVTGEDVPAHDWQATTRHTEETLEADDRFEVRVCEDIGILESEALDHYDVLILNFRNNPVRRDLPERGRDNLLRHVKSGGGLVTLHFAVAAFHNWPEYQKLLGRYWKRRHSKHDERGVFRVHIAAADHPVTRGVDSFEIDDELYARLVETRQTTPVLAADAELTSRREPIAWVSEYGKGRVFCQTLGHDVRSRDNDAFEKLLVQGTLWAAGSGRLSR